MPMLARLLAAVVVLAVSPISANAQTIGASSSNKKIETAFAWARINALSYVQTGKSGVVARLRTKPTGFCDEVRTASILRRMVFDT